MMRHVPPAVVPLLLIAIGVPAAFRAALGRPRALGTAWLAAAAAVAIAQVVGELSGSRVGVLGDAQLLYAAVAAAITSAALALVERAAR
jgi:hypothetical protein